MRRYRHLAPPAIAHRIGCVFGGLILFAAVGAGTVVSLITRKPLREAVIGIALFLAVMIGAAFATTIRRVADRFREQVHLRRQLMADVAHELRTPLSILQGRIEGLLDGVYPRDDAHLQELLAETQHLGRLVEDVRTLANAEAGALELRREPVDVVALIRETAASFARPIAIDAPPQLIVDADPVRLREVLLNIVGNAVQHAPGAAIAITVAKGIIRVTDNGPGIPAGELPHLFDRFHKGPRSRGSGLGLSIARKLVEAHGGTIEVASSAGAGTTVTIRLGG